jgi:hypothetical protein
MKTGQRVESSVLDFVYFRENQLTLKLPLLLRIGAVERLGTVY